MYCHRYCVVVKMYRYTPSFDGSRDYFYQAYNTMSLCYMSIICYLHSSLQTKLSKQRELLKAVVLHQVVWTRAVTEKNVSYAKKELESLRNKHEVRTNRSYTLTRGGQRCYMFQQRPGRQGSTAQNL